MTKFVLFLKFGQRASRNDFWGLDFSLYIWYNEEIGGNKCGTIKKMNKRVEGKIVEVLTQSVKIELPNGRIIKESEFGGSKAIAAFTSHKVGEIVDVEIQVNNFKTHHEPVIRGVNFR
jgi:hypothetical protein